MSNPHAHAGPVLVAVDGSSASLEALRHGHRMADLLGAELVAVTAWQPSRRGILPPVTGHPQENAEQLVYRSVIKAFRGTVPPPVRIVAVEGAAVDRLVELSRNADLLVVGSRGHSGLAGAILGSVSAHCAAHAQCPVLVVHAPPAAAPGTGPAAERHLSDPDHLVVTF